MFWEPNIQAIKDLKFVPGSNLRDVSKSNGFAVLLSSSHNSNRAYKTERHLLCLRCADYCDKKSCLEAFRTQERLCQ